VLVANIIPFIQSLLSSCYRMRFIFGYSMMVDGILYAILPWCLISTDCFYVKLLT